jgi:hypothetical protein
MSNGGKFKLYTVQNGLIFPTPTQPRISFERAIDYAIKSSLFVLSPEIEDRDEVEVGNWAKHKKTHFYSSGSQKKLYMNSLIYFSFPTVTLITITILKF